MRNKLTKLVAGLLLVLGASVALPASVGAAPDVPDTPESVESPERVLHNYDGWSQYYCIKHRPSNTFVIHSWPYALWPGGVGYWCQARSNDSTASWQYWVHVEPPYSANSWRPWQYQSCSSVPCGSAGHN